MNFTTACIGDIPELKRLWKDIFSDSDSYVDLFFEYKMKPECTFIAKENDEIAGAVYSVHSPIVLNSGEVISALYMCGICTKPKYRGRKIASKLIEKCFEFAEKQNVDLCYLIPANLELFEFYEKLGFEKATYINKIEVGTERCEISDFDTGFDKSLIEQYSKFDMPFKPVRNELEFRYIAECYSKIIRNTDGYVILDEDDEYVYLMEQTFDGISYAKNHAYENDKKLIVFQVSDDAGAPFSVVKKINTEIKLPKWGYINLMLN